MMSVQTRGGLVFGSATHIDGMNLRFEIEGQIDIGDNVEWRLELPGLDETAMGWMRITAVRREPGSPSQVRGLIQSVSPADAEIFEVWKRGVESGTRAFTVSKRPKTDSWLSATTMVGSSEAERKQAVAIEEERRKRRLERAKSLLKNTKSWPDPQDRDGGASVASRVFLASLSGSVARSVSGTGGGSPRSVGGEGGGTGSADRGVAERPRVATAAALKANINPAPAPQPAPDSPRWEPPPAPSTMPSAPVVLFDRGMASVRFLDLASFRLQSRPALLAGILLIPRIDAGPSGTAVQFVLTLPSGITVFTRGEVMAHSDTHSEFLLSLTPAQKGTLSAE
jgi:hypothetical protein